jgi:hypothetical protein
VVVALVETQVVLRVRLEQQTQVVVVAVVVERVQTLEEQVVQVSSSYVTLLHTNTLHRHTLRLREQGILLLL